MVDGNGQGIEQVFVGVYNVPHSQSSSFGSMTTGPGGYFSFAAAAGVHDLYFTGNGRSPNQAEVNVVDEYYSDQAKLSTANHVTVSDAQTLNLGDITLDIGATVSGHVTNASGTPLSGATVYSYDPAGNSRSYVTTDASGNYTLNRVPVGGATLRFSRSGYATEYHDDQPSLGAATTLATVSGETTSGVNAQLSPGGSVSGTIRDRAGSGVILKVWLYSVLDGAFSRASVTSAAGSGYFSFTYVKPGDYRIFFDTTGTSFMPQWHGGAAAFAEAAAVTVTEGQMTPGIDVVLGRTGTGDFSGDGKGDVLWRHATLGEVWLWPMDGTARTAETFVRTVPDTNWEIRGQGDQDGDGRADVLWRNKVTGQIYLWLNDSSAALPEIYVATVDPAYDIVGTGDYNGDGKSDILWRHLTNGEVWIWLMDGAASLGQVWVDTVDPAYVVKGSGDLDGDRKADIVWHHATLGEVWVWPMNGATRLDQVWVGTVPDTGYQIQGVADLSGDRKADILWHHATLGEVWIWLMDGTTPAEETLVATVPETDYRIVGTADYNGDGKADILWHHATLGEVWVWLMNGTTRVSETWVATVGEIGYQIVK